ncbi:VWA domain-containing protein [Halosimplex halophilum]|uniref:VWA domain-containing protein n=1 Tax=Halosimplex halophilum TaxID=2559572 RepID=UPI00107EFCC2|nr:VWA domain-containing protein [Halosimplex halophilum]
MIGFGGRINASLSGPDGPSFSEIVGQEELKRALLTVAVDDGLDGLLVRGEKGTAKSTAVRALADLLPEQSVVADCPYGCPPDEPARQCEACRERTDPQVERRPVPLVTLPLGATRERVVGSLSTADALDGEFSFEPGLLARANRGVLYVDEVNLLDDHLVDVLLDAAANGVNRVERDGVSVAHPAEFTLVGTMNPEEGDLRPQLRDRFALQATVEGCRTVDDRVAIIEQALGGERGRTTTDGDDGPTDRERRRQLTTARERLPEVDLPTEFAAEIARLCREAGVEGHRGDIATARAARALAALADRPTVIESDVRTAARLALPHRLKSRPFEDAPDPEERIDERFDGGSGRDDGSEGNDGSDTEGGADADDEPTAEGETDGDGTDGGAETGDAPSDDPGERDGSNGEAGPGGGDGGASQGGSARGGSTTDSGAESGEREADGSGSDGESDPEPDDTDADEAEPGSPVVPGQRRAGVGDADAPDLSIPDAVDRAGSTAEGRARARATTDADGPRLRTQRTDPSGDVDAAASVRAAAARGGSAVERRDLRESVRRSETAALVVFAVDTSASMRAAMRAAKGTVLELLRDAYQGRDEVAFVAFAGEDAEVLLPPTDSVARAARHLKDLPTGDRTPLPAGLRTASDVLDRADPDAGVVVLVTDGRANVAAESPVGETREAARRLAERDPHVVVVDADERVDGLTDTIAAETDGVCVSLADLTAERIDAAVARESEL